MKEMLVMAAVVQRELARCSFGPRLNRPFRDGHHITRSPSSGIPFPIRRLELPHVAAEVIVASSGAASEANCFEVDWASDRVFAEQQTAPNYDICLRSQPIGKGL